MPSPRDLPRGPRRDFVENLFKYVKQAGRPTLQQISDRIDEREDLPGTASKETVRMMLHGKTVPHRWANAYSVFLVLCELAEVDPTSPCPEMADQWSTPTHLEYFKDVWNRALDEPTSSHADPWANDEPPF